MGIIKCTNRKGEPILCKKCEIQLIKDVEDHTTYYPTHIGVVPMSWCPNCGKMLPLVERQDIDYISNNTKKLIGHRCALIYNRGLKEIRIVIRKHLHGVHDRYKFIERLSEETGLTKEQIMECAK